MAAAADRIEQEPAGKAEQSILRAFDFKEQEGTDTDPDTGPDSGPNTVILSVAPEFREGAQSKDPVAKRVTALSSSLLFVSARLETANLKFHGVLRLRLLAELADSAQDDP